MPVGTFLSEFNKIFLSLEKSKSEKLNLLFHRGNSMETFILNRDLSGESLWILRELHDSQISGKRITSHRQLRIKYFHSCCPICHMIWGEGLRQTTNKRIWKIIICHSCRVLMLSYKQQQKQKTNWFEARFNHTIIFLFLQSSFLLRKIHFSDNNFSRAGWELEWQ